jgi:hypothetical protein
MWPSPEGAARLYDVANFVLILSLVFGVIATVVIVWMGNAKEEYLQRDLAAAAHRAAEADARAAEAALALAKYRSPRVLTGAQIGALIVKMTPFKGQAVSTGAIPATHEGLSLAIQIAEVLKAAGLQASVNQGAAETHVGPVSGIVALAATGNAKGERFAAAFATAMSELGMPTYWAGGKMEALLQQMEKDNPIVRSEEYHAWVIIVVGDKR